MAFSKVVLIPNKFTFDTTTCVNLNGSEAFSNNLSLAISKHIFVLLTSLLSHLHECLEATVKSSPDESCRSHQDHFPHFLTLASAIHQILLKTFQSLSVEIASS